MALGRQVNGHCCYPTSKFDQKEISLKVLFKKKYQNKIKRLD